MNIRLLSKAILIAAFSGVLLNGCKPPVESKSEITEPTDKTPANLKAIAVNAGYPFGSTELAKLKFPASWEAQENKKPTAHDSLFMKIDLSYNQLITSKTIEGGGYTGAVEFIKIGPEDLDTAWVNLQEGHKTDSLKYRLPDVGRYRCYYYHANDKKIYGEFGNLLLIDTISGAAKLLNIYHMAAGDQHIRIRMFYMDGDTIQIYEGSSYDDGTSLDEKYIVKIRSDGEVVARVLTR